MRQLTIQNGRAHLSACFRLEAGAYPFAPVEQFARVVQALGAEVRSATGHGRGGWHVVNITCDVLVLAAVQAVANNMEARWKLPPAPTH